VAAPVRSQKPIAEQHDLAVEDTETLEFWEHLENIELRGLTAVHRRVAVIRIEIFRMVDEIFLTTTDQVSFSFRSPCVKVLLAAMGQCLRTKKLHNQRLRSF